MVHLHKFSCKKRKIILLFLKKLYFKFIFKNHYIFYIILFCFQFDFKSHYIFKNRKHHPNKENNFMSEKNIYYIKLFNKQKLILFNELKLKVS